MNVFDLQSNRRIRRYELRPQDTNANTFIANIAIDIGRNCEDAFAYFSDELGYGLIAYSWEQNRSWRFEHSFFFPDPLRGDFNIGGLNFQWGEEGIFGITLSPMQNDGFKTLYFSPLASHREFSVSTRILRDENRVEESYHDFSYFTEEREGNAHTTSRVMSDSGVMLFNLIDQNAVGCWNSETAYSPKNHDIVDRDDVGMVFPADVKIDDTNTVWVISDRMPVFLLSELDFTDINFRIFSAPLESLLQGTACESPVRGIHRFSPLSILKPNYVPESSLSPGYDTKYLGYDLPTTHIIRTSTTPKAFAYNQHNGVSIKTESPNSYFNHRFSFPTQNVFNSRQDDYQKNNNDWSSQFYY